MKSLEKKLLNIYRSLDDENQNVLLRFAEFLEHGEEKNIKSIEPPKKIEPKEGETVVGALKRLSASYSMLDKAVLLNDTSSLMAQHVIQGRAKEEVIDELENLFKTRYEELIRDNNSE